MIFVTHPKVGVAGSPYRETSSKIGQMIFVAHSRRGVSKEEVATMLQIEAGIGAPRFRSCWRCKIAPFHVVVIDAVAA